MRLLFALGLALAAATAAVVDGPVASFESDRDQPFAALGGAVIERVAEHATAGASALRVDIKGDPKDTWPGVLLTATDPDWSKLDLLQFDAFVDGDQPVQLGIRLDTLDGQGHFGSTPLKPGANQRAAVNIKAFSGDADLTRVKGLLIYVSRPRVDSRIYLDAFAWGRFAARFRKFVHVDPGPGLAPSAEEVRRGFQVETESPLRLVFPDTLPRRRATGLTLFACRGETEPLVFAVHALRELPEVRVEAGELRLPGAVIRAAALRVGSVRHLSKRWYYSADWFLADVPSYIADQPSQKLPSGRTGTFHLTFTAPPDARPGLYRGNVTVRAGAASQVLPLAVRVLPVTLPEPKGLFYGEYYRLTGRPADPRARIRSDLADMRAMGMTTVGLCFGVESSSYKVADSAVTFEFKGDTPFEWFMEAYRELGFPAPVVLLSDSGQQAAGQAGELGDAAYGAVYVAFYRALAEVSRAKGWPSLYVQPVDEPGWQSAQDRERNVALLKLLKEAGIPTEQDGPGDAYFHRQAGPFAAIWNYNGAIGRAQVLEAALNDVESFRPEADRWAYGFFNWRFGLHGGFNWEYRGGSGSLYDNNDAEHGDWVHRYLPEGGEPGGPSTGWIASREGVDDRRYLLLLEGLIARGKQRGGAAAKAAGGAQAVLDDLRARLDSRPDVRGLASFEALLSAAQAKAKGYALPPDAAGCGVGDLKQPNGLTYGEYDTVRWLVASQALNVAAALGEASPPPKPTWRPAAVGERVSVLTRGPAGGVESLPRPSVKLPELAAAGPHPQRRRRRAGDADQGADRPPRRPALRGVRVRRGPAQRDPGARAGA
ncbi:MAG: hypothetical protein HYU66_05935 [Armatimonadetes bacterium]|nr:hypothetical protein [Armatimonadota bacterium]